MSFLQDIFSDQFIYSLGWTLVHSLWQGAMIGLGIALTMIFLHKYSARLRYFIHSIGLFALAALAVITFVASYASYEPEGMQTAQIENMGFENGAYASTVNLNKENADLSFTQLFDRIADYCLEYFPLLTGIWILGMLTMMLRFLGSYALVRRYRHHRVKPVPGEWERRFQRLARNIKVGRRVRLLESALIHVPMVIGYFKPVVLLPLGALNGVPAVQMEAILVHELAHICRRDYLMNMIQSLLEVIFFYHPVAWWLSGNIRIERENICDDIAITQTGNTMEFAKALTTIQEINLGSPALAAGLSGKNRNRLLNRIRRISGNPRSHSGFAEGFIAASILMISLAGLSAAAMINNPTDYAAPLTLEFEEVGGVLPYMNYYQEGYLAPDTTEDKKKAQQIQQKELEKQKQIQYQKRLEDKKAIQEAMKEQQKEIQEAISLEMEAIKEKMKAVDMEIKAYVESEEYQDAYQKAVQNREEYEQQIIRAMEDYEKVMEEWRHNYKEVSDLTLPQVYFQDGKHHIISGDSLDWTYEIPENVYFYSYPDSLHDHILDKWSDNWEGAWDAYEDQLKLHKGNVLEAYADMDDLEELMEVAELEALEIPEFDYDYDYDYDYDVQHHFFMPGSLKRIVRDELIEDGLIEHRREYIVLIGTKQMLINGEKQSRSVFKKYRRLIDSMDEPWTVDENEEVSIHIGR